MTIPYSSMVDTSKLQRLFDNMSECYKLFWFKGIVDLAFEGKQELSYEEIIDKMIVGAWYMVCEYKLNLGPNDTLEKLIQSTALVTQLKSNETEKNILNSIYDLNDKSINKMKKDLTLNVPYRLQAPFLENDNEKNWSISPKKQVLYINQNSSIIYDYLDINGLQSRIKIRDSWMDYIQKNYEIIKGWIDYNTVLYIQRRNPAVPGISNKIYAPEARDLSRPTAYWKKVLEHHCLEDIYTGEQLSNKGISIDHFIPWSYVSHDELWNLVPTFKNINSSKSNNLPNLGRYLDKLSEIEYFAFDLTRSDSVIKDAFNKCADKHINDDNIRRRLYNENITKLEFSNRLKEIIEPVYNSASKIGFDIWKG